MLFLSSWGRPGLVALLAALPATAQSGTISNGQTVLAYTTDPSSGLVLTQAGDTALPGAFTLDAVDLWHVELRDPLTGSRVVVTPSASTHTFQLSTGTGTLTATWTDVDSSALPAGETFDVTVTLSATDAQIEFVIDVDASATTRSVATVDFPRVQFVERGAPASGVLTYPYVGGWLLPDPVHNPAFLAPAWLTNPGELSMQFFSYYDSSEGSNAPNLFLGTRDADGHFKQVRSTAVLHSGSPDALLMELRQVPEDNLNVQTYAAAYPFTLAVLRGDWYDAARAYRDWALNQPWATQGPMKDNGDFSDIVRQARMFAPIMVGQCCPVAEPPAQTPDECPCDFDYTDLQYWAGTLAEQRTTFGVTEIVGHAYNWDAHSWEGNWGEWYPVRSLYQTHAPQVEAQGDDFTSYFLPNVYSQSAPGYSSSYVPGYGGVSVETFAVEDETGALITESHTYCRGNAGCSVPAGSEQAITTIRLDLASPFALDFMKQAAETLAPFGSKGLYLDTYTTEPAQLNYNAGAGHALGGGSSYSQGKVQNLELLRDHMRQNQNVPEFFTYSEANSELFLDVLELTYSHNTGLTSDVQVVPGGPFVPAVRLAPLWETVYHDYQITGTFAGLIYPQDNGFFSIPGEVVRQIYAAALFLGRAPWAGGVLSPNTIAAASATDPEYADLIDMVANFMGVLGKPFTRELVTFGERVRDPAPVGTQPGTAVALPQLAPYGAFQPFVYATTYARPDLGMFGLLLLNWSDDGDSGAGAGTQTVTHLLNPPDYGLPLGTYSVQEVTAGGVVVKDAVDLGTPAPYTAEVPERDVRFFVFQAQ